MTRRVTTSSRRLYGIAAGALGVTLVVGLPELSLNLTVDAARACFEQFERGTTAPDASCRDGAARWSWLAVRTPWVRRRADLVLEELDARWNVETYVEAAIGSLDEDAAARAFEGLDAARQRVERGSQRLRLDELGPPMGLPHPARLAYVVGDRHALDSRAFSVGAHDVAKHAISAALAEGRGERAIRLGEHYHGHPNTDLRVLVGALDCMSKEPKPDELLREVETNRAAKRAANFARNYGEIRVVLEACARLHRVPPPPAPTETGAGQLDRYEQRMALGLRRWADECDPFHVEPRSRGTMGPCRASPRIAPLLADVEAKLASGEPLRYRLELLALLVPRFDDGRPFVRLARPRNAERSHFDRLPFAIDEWVWNDAQGEPYVMPEAFEAAASRLAELAVAGDPDKELVTLAAVMRMQAARGFALVGKADRAEDALDGAVVELAPLKGQQQLARSSLSWVLGDTTNALLALKPEELGAPLDRAAVRLQRAMLLLPDIKLAQAELVAARLDAGDDPVLVDRIRWWLAATGWTDASLAAPGDAEALPLVGDLAGVTPEVRAAKTSDALGVWRAWTEAAAATPEALRALRRKAMRARGAAPRLSLAPTLMLAARLAPPERAERWLDAFFILDAERVPVAYQAWVRYVAARGRGDKAAASLWRERFRTLMGFAHDPQRAELWRAAGI